MKIIWSMPALTDLQLAVAAAAELDTDWADVLLAEIQRVEAILKRHPRIAPVDDASRHRKLRLGRLPYLLLYLVAGDEIDILRLHHSRTDWQVNSW
ncbi:MAG: type II toxin-antitoxin system RelE/ParE family toxin [Pseudomonadota bacterium]